MRQAGVKSRARVRLGKADGLFRFSSLRVLPRETLRPLVGVCVSVLVVSNNREKTTRYASYSNLAEDGGLVLRPIGFLRCAKRAKFEALHQPDEMVEEENRLELEAGVLPELSTLDLAGFDRVWLIWWFHRNAVWRPQVIPPRGPQRRRGLFATRSPHRPVPLGLTPVRLLGIEEGGRVLRLGPCDLVEGTPIFDVKPYVPKYDAFTEARAGWIDEVDAEERKAPEFTVAFGPVAAEQAAWLAQSWRVDFTSRVLHLLGRDPRPHRTRRIRKVDEKNGGGFQVGCGAWRALFRVDEGLKRVEVTSLGPAYPLRLLEWEAYEEIPDRAAQCAFLKRWPESELPAPQRPYRGKAPAPG